MPTQSFDGGVKITTEEMPGLNCIYSPRSVRFLDWLVGQTQHEDRHPNNRRLQ